METQKNGKLVLIRHGESEWNKLGKWTGITEVHLSENGIEQAKKMGEIVKDIHFDNIFTSVQIRVAETLQGVLSVRNEDINIPIEKAKELNERDYGDYTGKNKWEMKEILGDEEFTKIRRSFDCLIPGGESLKDVYNRAVPFFLDRILPLLNEGKNVLLVAHGNSIRAIIKYIENVSDVDVSKVEMELGSVVFYDLDSEGHILKKDIKQI